ncbi:hypothetical protein [Paraburkholderia aromaticivorans]|uniref:hypothetical protein n=1 Tax=Paraburkholderia aromaticivorans TaxID=2026199 RepID=UPI0038BA7B31
MIELVAGVLALHAKEMMEITQLEQRSGDAASELAHFVLDNRDGFDRTPELGQQRTQEMNGGRGVGKGT